MPVSEFKVFFDNEAADEERLALFSMIKVDQAIGMVTEAELEIPIGLDSTGAWEQMEEDFVQVFKRLRVEVKVGAGDFIPLIDGPIVGQRYDLSASPNESKMIVTVHDDSALMNLFEKVELFEDKTADQIATQLFQEAGLTAQTDSVSPPTNELSNCLVQRGTAMHFLRQLARNHGMFVYVEPGENPGESQGFFKNLDLSPSLYPELLLIGADRNTNKFTAHFDGLRPVSARTDGVDVSDDGSTSITTLASNQSPLGDEATHDIVEAGEVFLTHARQAHDDGDGATASTVNHSSWAYSAQVETAENYEAVLLPYRTINVAGVGGQLSGSWMISQVTHEIKDSGFKQVLGLRRNARSSGGASNPLGGIF